MIVNGKNNQNKYEKQNFFWNLITTNLVDIKMKPKIEWKELVEELIKGLEFGVLQITIHQGEVVQIEKTEKHIGVPLSFSKF